MSKTGTRRVVLTVAPIGNNWSVLEGGTYRGLYKLKSHAAAAAEKRASTLRTRGHTAVIRKTNKKPGGR